MTRPGKGQLCESFFVLSSVLVTLLSLSLASLLRSRLIFAIAAICWVQNILLPWCFTQGWIDVPTTRSLLALKELLLLLLMGYAAWQTRWVWSRRIPTPVVWILAYALWAVLRFVLGAVVLGEPILDDIRLVRSVLFPAEAVMTGFLVAILTPNLPSRYRHFTIVGLILVSAASLALYLFPSDTFWLNHVNVALYNVNVKGDPEWTVLADLGISGSGAGRSMFSVLSAFRLFGTFGDPLTAGMVLGLPIIALSARRHLNAGAVAAMVLLAVSVVLTFSRSAWVLVTVGFTYLALIGRRPTRLLLLFGVLVVLWVSLRPLREFLGSSVASLQLEAGDVYHAQGILKFYSAAMINPAYLIGTGPLDNSAQSWVLENGLAYLMVQLGLPLLVSFVGFCLSAERYLRRRSAPRSILAGTGAACALASLVVSNFSFYALSFTAYFGIWSIVGLAIGTLHRGELESRMAAGRVLSNGFAGAES